MRLLPTSPEGPMGQIADPSMYGLSGAMPPAPAHSYFKPEVESAISDMSDATGHDLHDMRVQADIESSGRPTLHDPGSSYKGLYQLSDEEFKANSQPGQNIYDARANANAYGQLATKNQGEYMDRTGNFPAGGPETYLTHQQGPGYWTGQTIPYKNLAGNLPTEARTTENTSREGHEAYWRNDYEQRSQKLDADDRDKIAEAMVQRGEERADKALMSDVMQMGKGEKAPQSATSLGGRETGGATGAGVAETVGQHNKELGIETEGSGGKGSFGSDDVGEGGGGDMAAVDAGEGGDDMGGGMDEDMMGGGMMGMFG